MTYESMSDSGTTKTGAKHCPSAVKTSDLAIHQEDLVLDPSSRREAQFSSIAILLHSGITKEWQERTLLALRDQIHSLVTILEAATNASSPAECDGPESSERNNGCAPCSNKQADDGTSTDELDFKRVDQTWDASINDYRMLETKRFTDTTFDRNVFVVRRKFDWENRLVSTEVDINSSLLRDDLRDVMKGAKSICLLEARPSIEPEMLYLYESDIRKFRENIQRSQYSSHPNCRVVSLQLLEGYLNEDFKDQREDLRNMLNQGLITFDLAWALFKPHTIVICKTYGASDVHRCFRVSMATKESSFNRGCWYEITGQFFGYDGRSFGLGEISMEVPSFKGQRRIADLAVFPLEYHPDAPALSARLIDRGRKLIRMPKMSFKFLSGLGFKKVKESVRRMNVESRVMVDPLTFRRLHPDYPLATIRSKEELSDRSDNVMLLISSPIVLGFVFSEKCWLELSLDGMRDIEWGVNSFDRLVLEDRHKQVVRGVISSYKDHDPQTMVDIIEKKGQGLVFVLHGPPGVGKTLTAEAIAESLQFPLYAISAGELGTQPEGLERQLRQTMELVHAWGAVLLLDEADVFLERREVSDVHRNALVSIFLRLLEYFQGILILTTNRIHTFDEAFQSRIHVPLFYKSLDFAAKKQIWKSCLEDIRDESMEVLHESAIDELARHEFNGRQIRNTVRMAKYLSLYQQKPFGMKAIRDVLEIEKDFERDIQGGVGHEDMMRAYV